METCIDQQLEEFQLLAKSCIPSIEAQKGIPKENVQALSRLQSQLIIVVRRDIVVATRKGLESISWHLHKQYHEAFRQTFSSIQDSQVTRKHVVDGRQEVGKNFLKFIKDGQKCYRELVQQLAWNSFEKSELQDIAHGWNEEASTSTPTSQSQETAALGTKLCHISLIRLGDLSRWREELMGPKTSSYSSSIEFYELAGRILPTSGTCHNQLATINLTNGDIFNMAYELYRSLASLEPHDSSEHNLKSLLGERLHHGRFASGEGDLERHGCKTLQSSLESAVLDLHAYLILKPEGREQTLLEDALLQHLFVATDQDGLQDVISKVLLMSLAAEDMMKNSIAAAAKSPRSMISFVSFLIVNTRMFAEMITKSTAGLLASLASISSPEPAMQSQTVLRDRQYLLRWLRQLSAWLTLRVQILSSKTIDDRLDHCFEGLRQSYNKLLRMLFENFSFAVSLEAEYLLEEDEAIVGFVPLTDFKRKRLRSRYYIDGTATFKPPWHGKGVRRLQPNEEMLARVGDILRDGISLSRINEDPLQLNKQNNLGGLFAPPTDVSRCGPGSNEMTHVSETKLSMSTEAAPCSRSRGSKRTTSTTNISAESRQVNHCDHGKDNTSGRLPGPNEQQNFKMQREDDFDDATYGHIPSSLFGKLTALQDRVEGSKPNICVSSGTTSMPDPTAATSVMNLPERDPRHNPEDLVEEAMNSSQLFTGSNISMRKHTATPPPGQWY